MSGIGNILSIFNKSKKTKSSNKGYQGYQGKTVGSARTDEAGGGSANPQFHVPAKLQGAAGLTMGGGTSGGKQLQGSGSSNQNSLKVAKTPTDNTKLSVKPSNSIGKIMVKAKGK